MRILGVDIGTVRLGMAVSDPMGMTAQPLPTIEGGSAKKVSKSILSLVLEYEKTNSEKQKIKTVVIGNPIHLNGTESDMSKMAKECVRLLKEYFKQNFTREIDIILQDERLTSVAAEKVLLSADLSRKKRKEIKDRVAAQLILQNYLDIKKVLI
ncbi:MAG: Holliday junction resolvase RuvX [Chlamydiae bacterium]|nr:MAG: Holliday junction resolvase RuvX [Chlamydiota bacterium]